MKKGYETRLISYECINLIKYFEGLRTKAYQCAAGVWTIGYGHTRDVKPGDEILPLTADRYLYEDLTAFADTVNEIAEQKDWYLEQCEFDSMVSFAFNCGVGAITKVMTKMEYELVELGCDTDDQIESHADYIYSNLIGCYNKARNRILDGLVKRREIESKVFTIGWGCEILTNIPEPITEINFAKCNKYCIAPSLYYIPISISSIQSIGSLYQYDNKLWLRVKSWDGNAGYTEVTV